MPRYVTLRLLDSFFRHWLLYLVPVVLVTGLGVLSIRDQPSSFRSTGTFYVEGETYLSALTAVRGGGDIGYQTPAGYYGGQLQGLLQTDAFIADIAERAGVDRALYRTNDEMLDQVRQMVGVTPAGDNLMLVWAEHPEAAVAHRLADTLVDGFIQWQIDSDVNASMAAQGFFDGLLDTYQEDLLAAQQALDVYLRDNPVPPDVEDRPLAQQIAIDRLQGDVTVAEQRYVTARAKEEDARLATAQTESDVRQRLRLVDEPVEPGHPESMLLQSLMVVVLFGAMGTMLTTAAVVLGTLADRSVRHPLEVKQRLGLELLAVVPDGGR